MKYEVIHYFTDLQDFDHPYHVGDKFPRDGMKVSEERLKELAGSNNKQHMPLIKRIEETQELVPFEPEMPKYTKTEISRMSTADLRKVAERTGVANAHEMTGAELKEYLIGLFGL